MEKKRYEISVAGVELAIISDEREEFVKTLVENLDREIKDITVRTKRSSNLDAAILCALEYYSEKLKAEKRARNLEAQISLYDANLRRFREENIALREKLESLGKIDAHTADSQSVSAPEAPEAPLFTAEKDAAPSVSLDVGGVVEPSDEAKNESKDDSANEQKNDSINKTEEKSAPAQDDSRAARLRAIEELLGRGGKRQ